MDNSPVAIFSDVHANLEALESVLSDARGQGISRFICLGDVVGYGPDPAECLEIIQELGCPMILGNHDQAVGEMQIGQMPNAYAAAGIEYSKNQLDTEHRDFLSGLPLQMHIDGCIFAHGSVDENSPWDYVITREGWARQFLTSPARFIFLGHTHRPALWQFDVNGLAELDSEGAYSCAPGARYGINVGSVGQPRNLRPEACYVIFHPEEERVEFRYVDYDFKVTQKKISRAGLPKFLGQRLALGR
jgi:diadenosine tetraphosphatase ApaH/serine/threonine PP2A family protein phosphatase